jgi:hypothetical protein
MYISGTTNPPTGKGRCKPEAITLDVNIVASKEYYWKVVKDDKGRETIGQTLKFRTN